MAAILNFGSGTMSGNVRSDIFKSRLVDNVGIAVRIATPSLAVQKLFPLPVLLAAILNFGSLPSSTNVDQRQPVAGGVLGGKSKSAMIENWGEGGQPLESRHNELLLQSYFKFRFGGRHVESAIHEVGRCRQLHNQVGRGRKCGGSRWNYVCMLLQTQVTSTMQQKIFDFSR